MAIINHWILDKKQNDRQMQMTYRMKLCYLAILESARRKDTMHLANIQELSDLNGPLSLVFQF